MVKYIIRKPNKEDVKYFNKYARQADKNEVFLFSGKTIGETLKDIPDVTQNSYVWEVEGKPVSIFGVSSWGDDNIIWLLATDDFEEYKNIFRTDCKKVFEELIKDYNYLYNYVYAKHKKAIRWLKWLGANILEPQPVGLGRTLFCKFEFKNNYV